ncbi:MAG: S-layer homology domain-containing protein [Clostridia bacterium]|nr:S-layer homology domain-containing protein [Clostridia bacterium]
MMFKKWRITGLNKVLSFFLAFVLALGLPAAAATARDFTDLNPQAWYYSEVSGAIEAGLFSGVSDTLFDAEGAITRAQFVTVLSRLCKVDVSRYATNQFTDVQPEHWFYPYVSWAYAFGITNGTSPTTFSPHNPINRQEMCKMLGNAIEGVLGRTMRADGATAFADQSIIADWAQLWVKKCNANGLFLGDDQNCFSPYQHATRAQAAAVFFRCYSNPNLMPPVEQPPAEEPPAEAEYTLSVSGFTLDFDVDTDYYLAAPADFANCRINGYTGFKSLTVSVEQYATYYPYRDTAYKLGDALLLGNGRAKVTLNATLKDGTTREYLIALTDPNSADYAYAKAYVTSSVHVRKGPGTDYPVLKTLLSGARVYYLKTEGEWCKVQLINQVNEGAVGYIHRNYLRWKWQSTEMPESYKASIEALQAAHPNWYFEFVDVEMTMAEALDKYGAANESYIDPLNYLNENKIYAFLNIDVYDQETWNDAGIKAIWANEYTLQKYPELASQIITKSDAVKYFKEASASLKMNPYYIACRAALESGYGSSVFARGKVAGYEGYYNFFGIRCYTANPTPGAAYAKERNWNSNFRSIVEGANWIKDQYLDQGSITPYFFRFSSIKGASYMDDVKAPGSEASILKRAFTDANAKAHFVVPVYRAEPPVQE